MANKFFYYSTLILTTLILTSCASSTLCQNDGSQALAFKQSPSTFSK